MITLNATESYKLSGYKYSSDNVAGVMAFRMLRNTKIKTEIDLRLAKRATDNGITADYVLTSLKAIAERCMQQEPVYNKQGEETGEFKFDSSGANKSLELLGKHLKLFTDKVESENTNHNIEIKLDDDLADWAK